MISLVELKTYLASYPERPPRTVALEQRIQIGTGFHGKWYRSQREHWLGWSVVQECQSRMLGKEPAEIDAGTVWGRLKCSPMMFWLAECAGVSDALLDEAESKAIEASGINATDGNPHGKKMRSVLPWSLVATAMSSGSPPPAALGVEAEARSAFERLIEHVPAYRKHRDWLT